MSLSQRARHADFFSTASLALGGCAADASPSVLDPVGEQAVRVGRLWWVMLAVSVFVFLVVLLLMVGSLLRRR